MIGGPSCQALRGALFKGWLDIHTLAALSADVSEDLREAQEYVVIVAMGAKPAHMNRQTMEQLKAPRDFGGLRKRP